MPGRWTPDRLGLYVEKALREAKVNTNWIDQDHEWEEGAKRFAAGLLDDVELGEYAPSASRSRATVRRSG